ncbi:inorganic phosphate transporter [Kocuria rhizophila]|nr:inorganic phosphate transporter [Kocuria rhizophila]
MILGLVVVTALAFDFTNGFDDTGNAMATSIATGALKPRTAAAMLLRGAEPGGRVPLRGGGHHGHQGRAAHPDPDGGLVSGLDPTIALTLDLLGAHRRHPLEPGHVVVGLPSSSSHALFGGLIGAGLASLGVAGVNWAGVVQKILVPAALAPFIAGCVAAVGTALVYLIARGAGTVATGTRGSAGTGGTASLVSLADGTGDAQKTMGVMALADRALQPERAGHRGRWPPRGSSSRARWPSPGTVLGGWRVIRTLGRASWRSSRRRHGGRGVVGGHHPDLQPLRHGAAPPRTWPPAPTPHRGGQAA